MLEWSFPALELQAEHLLQHTVLVQVALELTQLT
jgi:hypothetical protein